MAEYGKYFSNLKRNASISLDFKVGQTVIIATFHIAYIYIYWLNLKMVLALFSTH